MHVLALFYVIFDTLCPCKFFFTSLKYAGEVQPTFVCQDWEIFLCFAITFFKVSKFSCTYFISTISCRFLWPELSLFIVWKQANVSWTGICLGAKFSALPTWIVFNKVYWLFFWDSVMINITYIYLQDDHVPSPDSRGFLHTRQRSSPLAWNPRFN